MILIRVLSFISYLITLYTWIIIASAVLSWLIGFSVVNLANPNIRQLWKVMMAVTEPLLNPIRRLLPSVGGLDFSPVVLLFAIIGLADYLIPFLMRKVG